MANEAVAVSRPVVHTKLNRQQITGFWGAWAGWTLDGMDSVIYALVLSPALTELLPKSGIKATPATVAYAGSVLFALFLVGWGLSLIWGPIADRFGRTRVLAATIFVYAIFTGAAAMSQTVWQLGLFRLLAGIGIGGEWALAGTYVAEAWPEDRRKMGAGYLQTGYYAGFFLASALNYTVGAHFGWRAMFWCGLTPVVVAVMVLLRVKEPERWERKAKAKAAGGLSSLIRIFSPPYTRRTLVNTILLASAICGLWAGAVYAPTAIINLAKRAGMLQPDAVRTASLGMGLLSLGTILGCLAVPPLAERFGRKRTLAFYFGGMLICILLSFGWAYTCRRDSIPSSRCCSFWASLAATSLCSVSGCRSSMEPRCARPRLPSPLRSDDSLRRESTSESLAWSATWERWGNRWHSPRLLLESACWRFRLEKKPGAEYFPTEKTAASRDPRN